MEAREKNGRIALRVSDPVKGERTLVFDHAIASTGFEADADRITFLASECDRLFKGLSALPG
jgi:hypothetical protein